MIVDTSPVIAILAREPDAATYAQALASAPRCLMSAGTFVELGIVLERQFNADAVRECDALFRKAKIEIEPVTDRKSVV